MFDIITPTYNSAETIRDTILSVQSQGAVVAKHIIVDGDSSDATLKIIDEQSVDCLVVSEKDNGIYDALNKGLSLSSAPFIGILHSDDVYFNPTVLSRVLDIFEQNPSVDIVYGNLIYTSDDLKKIKRTWRDPGNQSMMWLGWMPPHPSTFYRKTFAMKVGAYNTEYKISADYEYLIRSIIHYRATLYHLDEVLVKMRIGGASNNSIKNILRKTCEDLWILQESPLLSYSTLIFKKLRKIKQLKLNCGKQK